MLKLGITGGIGSGKSTVCQVFETLGIPVFYADHAAKMLMEQDPELMAAIGRLFGPDIYTDGKLRRAQVAALVFNEPVKLKALNDIVHPATISYGARWMGEQTAPYVIKEAAIFFESGSHKQMDLMMGVYAPKELRIERTQRRDHITREQVLDRMARQMGEEEKMALCDYVIINDDLQAIIPQVLEIHSNILSK